MLYCSIAYGSLVPLKICFPSGSAGSSPAVRTISAPIALALALTLAGCDRQITDPLTMSVIGSGLHMGDPGMGAQPPASRVLLGALAQGLVAFDSRDQVEPALAERWIVTDDGLSYIFRIREAKWHDGRIVSSADVVASLKRSFASTGRNPLRSMFSNVAAVIPMTGQVVEIRLKAPEPNFLQLLAQPELAILRSGGGTGPYRIHSRRDGVVRLRLVPDIVDEEDVAPAVNEADDVRIRAERAAMAVARFQSGDATLVLGGTFASLPLARAAKPDTGRFQVDPAYGLFGLGVVAGSKALERVEARIALLIALDRDAMLQHFGTASWRPSLSVLPVAFESSSPPAAMSAVQQPIEERRRQARSLLQSVTDGGRPLKVRVAMPVGSGARLLFAAMAADWKRVGIDAVPVNEGEPSDLVLIDEVAPVSSAMWYLQRLSCGRGLQCDPAARAAFDALLAETDPGKRRALIGAADAALVSAVTYIPIALPLRWSLVGTDLVGWQKSAFAVHSLRHVRQ